MDLKTLDWDEGMLKEFNIPRRCLAKILGSTDNFGLVKEGILKNKVITGYIVLLLKV